MKPNIYKPILFSTEMVQAILAGSKTQTRRIIKSRHESGIFQVCKNFDGKVTSIESLDWDERNCEKDILSKYQIDDILWVRETFCDVSHNLENENCFLYKADFLGTTAELVKWKPSLFMPKEAARIFLKVTNVRCERLQDINRGDGMSEGCPFPNMAKEENPVDWFSGLWNSINAKKHPWESNPWVWVYDFDRIEKPADFI